MCSVNGRASGAEVDIVHGGFLLMVDYWGGGGSKTRRILPLANKRKILFYVYNTLTQKVNLILISNSCAFE